MATLLAHVDSYTGTSKPFPPKSCLSLVLFVWQKFVISKTALSSLVLLFLMVAFQSHHSVSSPLRFLSWADMLAFWTGALPLLPSLTWPLDEYSNIDNPTDPNYRKAYYKSKLGFDPDIDHQNLDHLKYSYLEVLSWSFAYYHKGLVSWSWYYPYHYAPLITGTHCPSPSSSQSLQSLPSSSILMTPPYRLPSHRVTIFTKLGFILEHEVGTGDLLSFLSP